MHEIRSADMMLLLGYFGLCQGYSSGPEPAYTASFPLIPFVTFTEYFLSLGLIMEGGARNILCYIADLRAPYNKEIYRFVPSRVWPDYVTPAPGSSKAKYIEIVGLDLDQV